MKRLRSRHVQIKKSGRGGGKDRARGGGAQGGRKENCRDGRSDTKKREG